VQNLYFGTLNTTDRTLSVPLEYQSLNSIESVTGGATPEELFAPGSSGFAVPETNFVGTTGLYGVWKFLGQVIPIPTEPEVCSDTGVPGECRGISDTQLLKPFEYTRRAVIRMVTEANRAARINKWRTDNSAKFSKAFLRRSAAILAKMKRELVRSNGNKFVCDVGPMACTHVRISSTTLIRSFSTLYDIKFPRGLEHLAKLRKREVTGFKALLGSTPLDYFVCE